MITEEEVGPKVILTAPLSLEGESDDADYRAPNLLQRILSLFSSVRPGSDLTRIQLPPLFNLPKSQLQCYGESVYCFNIDMLSKCGKGESSLERMTSVVAWSISTLRPLMFGVAPYNPILGETHHVSRASLNVLLEQVSHHPPVTALHATDEKENIEMIWCHNAVPKFCGTKVETEVHGKRELKLLNKQETYVMNSPKLVIRLLPFPGVDWVGNVTLKCEETGLQADLYYRGSSFLSNRGNRSVKGKIFVPSSSKTICEINGHWDRTVIIKDMTTGKVNEIYNAKEALSGMKTPIVKDPKVVMPSESTVAWAEVSQSILSRSWDKAKQAKTIVEERERELAKERKFKSEIWTPKHFTVSYSKESGWEVTPNERWIPPAPIIVPT
ncbi:oxysterol-binding protein-related protein 4B-like [Lycium ferocissimum]|uniref:oxysterol-binding protein-related protein 4B-like n=1 Tax=Lycium ferocissimum TaxID=112874 RepID=UPI00281530D8|nr:oxysterol-binding protein-related protein 4B-like [Lycium ferocissimum]